MTSRGNARRPPNTLTIHPPSPGFHRPQITTPISQIIPQIISPRKAPLPPSPTYSSHSNLSGLSAQDGRSQRGSHDTHGPGVPPVPRKDDKRLPGLPFSGLQLPRSPRKRPVGEEHHGQGAGMYDNKLVSSTLSQLPPLSPTPTGNVNLSPHLAALSTIAPSMNHKASYSSIGMSPRPSMSTMPSSLGVMLPDGTSLAAEPEMPRSDGRSMKETMAHSSPSSPWSLLTIHVLPIFAGSPLKSPVEDLNHLCHSHIIATSQRSTPSRLVAVLSSDLRDFIASGMLTLKSKLETADDTVLIPRLAATWKFFWTHVLSYLEGVFLPFSQMRDLPSTSTNSEPSHPIPVRHILLSGFMTSILLPQLSRLSILISNSEVLPPEAYPAIPDMQQVLQMVLVLSTQARYSSFSPLQSPSDNERVDGDIKENVQILGKAVRWRIGVLSQPSQPEEGSPLKSPLETRPKRASLQRVSSMTQAGRHRRPGWRASNAFGQGQIPLQTSLEGIHPSRQNSDFFQPESRWGRPRVDEEDEDDHTPGQNYAPSRQDSYASTATTSMVPSAASTLTAGTWREGHGYGESQRTPQADHARRGLQRADTEDSEATPVVTDTRRGQRM